MTVNTQTETTIQDDRDAPPPPGEGELVSTLFRLFEARQAKNAGTKDDELLSPPVKAYLEAHPGVVLRDEHGIEASLTKGRGFTTWDLRPLTAEQVLALWHAGLLTMQEKLFDAMRVAAPLVVWDEINSKPGVRVRVDGAATTLQVRQAAQ